MKSKVKTISLFVLSLLYPYLLIDLVLDEAAPWNPIFNRGSFLQNNWVSFLILVLLFFGILYLGQIVFYEKKDEPNVILKVVYKNVIGLSILIFLWVFSICMILLLANSDILYIFFLYILFFPILFSGLYYLLVIKKDQTKFSSNFYIMMLFLGVVLPVILYGLLAAAVI
ncbi:MAG: hypothetical protein CVV57_06425 [Tenericutes bacterium HGW-Tenericutes-2]|jgi:hypothetical protein|nr:MAG: hypothetical protein CVV57_06425 [Tenericutes bacterium HGW-Tenericutes-2]